MLPGFKTKAAIYNIMKTKRIAFDLELWRAGKGRPVYRVGYYPDCVLDTGHKDWPLVSVTGPASETHTANGRARNEYETTIDLLLEVTDQPRTRRIGFKDWENLPVVWIRHKKNDEQSLVCAKQKASFWTGNSGYSWDSDCLVDCEWSTNCVDWHPFDVEA